MKQQSLLLLMLITVHSPVYSAGVDSSLGDFFNGLSYSENVTNPSAFKGQSADYYTGGNLFVRTPIRDVQLMSMQVPKMSIGCGGIDMFMGGFSHINSDALVQQGKAIIANATPFAVDLALQTWAPQIKQIKENLTAISDKFLNLSVNSCEAAQASVSALASFADVGSQQYICNTMGTQNNAFADWVSGQQECGAGGQATAQLAKAKNDPVLKDMVKSSHNIVWAAIRKNSLLSSNTKLAEFVMSISGTYIYDADGKPTHYGSLLTNNQNIINSLLLGGKAKSYECDSTDETGCLSPSTTDITISSTAGLQYRVVKILEGITNKLLNDLVLTNQEEDFLEYTDIPVMIFIRTALEAKLSPPLESYAKVVSIEFLIIYLNDLLSLVTESLSGTNNDPDDLNTIEEDILAANRYLRTLLPSAYNAVTMENDLIRHNQAIKKQVVGQLSMRARSNAAFGE